MAVALLVTGCTNYLAVRREAGPQDDVRYKLGSLPVFGEQTLYEDLCSAPRQLALKWANALVQSKTLTADQGNEFSRAVCEPDLGALRQFAERLTGEQITALSRSLHALDPYYSVDFARGLERWAQWAIAGAVLIAVGLVISAERTGFFESGGGRYQNRRRALSTGSGAAPPPPPPSPGGGGGGGPGI